MPDLPNGTLTLVFTDVEGSTELVRRRGDEFFVVFEDADKAAAATVEAQLAFAEHEWPDGVELRVRMGMHTGEPTFREGTYYGLDVHRAARIAQAGSGGQILLSQRTREELDSSHELDDLGEHELSGFEHPERLF